VTLRNYESLGKYVPHFLHIPTHALWLSINRTVLEDVTNTKSHGNQRLHVQWWKAPDDGHNSVRNM
jgi:hypothetical protein